MLLFISVIIILLVLIGLVYPLLRKRGGEETVETDEDRRVRELLSRKESFYSTIKELDFDFKTDKLSEEDYKELKERYQREAISLLREVDEVEKRDDLEDLVEKEVLSRRRSVSSLREKGKSGDLENIIEEEILARRESFSFCSHCGSRSGAKDKFCSNCGRELKCG